MLKFWYIWNWGLYPINDCITGISEFQAI